MNFPKRNKKEILYNFNKLKNYNNKFSKDQNGNLGIISDYDKEKIFRQITDYFTMECRLKCRFKNSKYTPWEYFTNNKSKLLKESKVNGKLDLDKLEDIIYNNRESKFCNTFPVTVALAIYRHFNAKNILDSSAGWGDRLIAAIANNSSYTGVDPSECLQPLYNNIISTLQPKNSDVRYKIISKPFEDAKIYGKYDLVFTSPPFFDLEIYENNKKQSISRYRTHKIWITKFLIPLVEKNIKHLEKNGYLVLYVPLYPLFRDYIMNNKNVVYLGKMQFITPKIRNIFVWKKL